MRGGRRAAAHAPPTPQGRNGIADHLLGPQGTRGPAPTMQPPPAPPRPSLSPPIRVTMTGPAPAPVGVGAGCASRPPPILPMS